MTTQEELLSTISDLYMNRLSSKGNTLIAQFVEKYDLKNPEFWNTPVDLMDKNAPENKNLEGMFNGVQKGVYVAAIMQLYTQLILGGHSVTLGGKQYTLTETPDPEYLRITKEFATKQPKTLGGFFEIIAYGLGEAPIEQPKTQANPNPKEDKTMLYVGIGGAVAVVALIGIIVAKKSR